MCKSLHVVVVFCQHISSKIFLICTIQLTLEKEKLHLKVLYMEEINQNDQQSHERRNQNVAFYILKKLIVLFLINVLSTIFKEKVKYIKEAFVMININKFMGIMQIFQKKEFLLYVMKQN